MSNAFGSRPPRRFTALLGVAAPLLGFGSVANAQEDLGIIVPAYFYPGGAGLGYWNDMNDAADDVPLIAIMNPGSGPGNNLDPNYTAAVDNLRAAGGTVIGYVSTSYTNRSLAAVQDDIDDYVNWYNLDGIFLDEFTNTSNASHLDYYETLYDYIKGIDPAWTVVGNPGTSTTEPYLTRPTADILMVHENFGANYPGYTPSSWNNNYPSTSFSHLVHTQPSAAAMLNNLDQAVAQNAGWVYVTDDVLGNPWDRLPTYWDQEVQRVIEINDGGGNGGGPIKPGGLETRYNPVANGSLSVTDTPGDRGGWAGVEPFSNDPAGDANPQVDFVGLTVAHDDNAVYFRTQRDAAAANPLDFHQNIFIDADQDRATGFIGGGGFLPVGVDFLLQGGTLYSFANGANQEAWGWNSVSAVDFDDSPSTDIELALARALIGNPVAIDLVLNGANTGTGSVEDYYPNTGDQTLGSYFTYAFVPLPLEGDFDGSGQVEQGDLDLVLQNWGLDTDANGLPTGWINDNENLGQIEQTELDRVLSNWGSLAAPDLSGASVPEPAALSAVAALLTLTLRRRR